jgi:hypothetical protein
MMLRKSIVLGNLAILFCKEDHCWAEEIDGKYGLSITYWQRSKWQCGVRFSLLWCHIRPFVRVTTYSCPMFGTAGTVKSLNCVAQLPSRSNIWKTVKKH